MNAPDPQVQPLTAWRALRRRAYRAWCAHIGIAVIGAVWFVSSYDRADPTLFAVLLLVPLLALRGAWRNDREIRACNARMRESAALDAKASFGKDGAVGSR